MEKTGFLEINKTGFAQPQTMKFNLINDCYAGDEDGAIWQRCNKNENSILVYVADESFNYAEDSTDVLSGEEYRKNQEWIDRIN